MEIIERNFKRLLRAGAFDLKANDIEPMSPWKWEQLYKLSVRHRVTPWIAEGIRKCQDSFFLQISNDLRRRFDSDTTDTTIDFGRQELTNPLLNRLYQRLAAESGTEDPTFNLLQRIVAIARQTMSSGISIRQLVVLGIYLQQAKESVDYEVLSAWINRLGLRRMAKLEGCLLMELLDMDADQIPFTDAVKSKRVQHIVSSLFSDDAPHRYLSYYPSEAVTNYTSNLLHHIQNIEE